MFETLSERLSGALEKLTGKGALNEGDIGVALREVRVALLEADVSLSVVRSFIREVQEKATGSAVLKSVTPGQQVIKIVHDELIRVLAGDNPEPGKLRIDTPPAAILMVGLQGSGKTTTTAKLAKRLNRSDFRVQHTTDLEDAARGAHIISCATLSAEPLIAGEWLQNGQHLDLVGGFRPDMRETDDTAIRRARVFVDTRAGACKEAGDIVQPLESGVLDPDDIAADLFELTRGERAGRRFYDQITLFKSVGTAIEDLAAAQLTVERV